MNVVRVMLEIAARAVGLQNIQAASTALDTVKGKANDASASFKNLAGAFTSIVVGQYLRRGLEGLIKPAADFDLALRQLRISSGATGQGLKHMEEVALKAAERYPYTPLEAVRNLNILRRALGNTEEAIATLDTSFALAMASFDKIKPEKAATMLAAMGRSFGMSSKEIKLGANQIFALTKVMGTEIQDFSDVMGSLGVAAIRGGQSFQEMAQAFALVRNIMPSSKQAATQLVRAMGELGKPKTREALYDLGIEIKDLSTGKIRPASEVFIQIAESMHKNLFATRDALTEAFGERSTKAILSTLAQLDRGVMTTSGRVVKGAEAYVYMSQVMKDGTKSLNDAQNIYSASTQAALTRAEQAWWNFRRAMGETLLNAVASLADALGGLLNIIRGFVGLPGVNTVVKMLLRMVALVAGVGAIAFALFGMKRILGAVMIQFVSAQAKAYSLGQGLIGLGVKAQAAGGMMNVLRGGLRSVVPAIKAVGLSIKGLLASTGIGLLLMLLPEAIEGWRWFAKRVYQSAQAGGWLYEKIKSVNSSLVTMGNRIGEVMGLKQAGAIGEMGAKGMFKWLTNLDKIETTMAKANAEVKSLTQSMQDGAKTLYDYMHLGSKEMEEVVTKLQNLGKYDPKPIDFKVLEQAVQRAEVSGADKTLTANMRKMLESAKISARAARAGTISPQEALKMASQITDVTLGAKHLQVMSGGTLYGKTQMKTLEEAQKASTGALTPTAALATQHLVGMRGGRMLNEPGTMVPGYQQAIGGVAMKSEQVMEPGMRQSLQERLLRAIGFDVQAIADVNERRLSGDVAPLREAAYTKSEAEKAASPEHLVAGLTTLGMKMGEVLDALKGELKVTVSGSDPFLGSSASLTGRAG